jgi:hypothetical protein
MGKIGPNSHSYDPYEKCIGVDRFLLCSPNEEGDNLWAYMKTRDIPAVLVCVIVN